MRIIVYVLTILDLDKNILFFFFQAKNFTCNCYFFFFKFFKQNWNFTLDFSLCTAKVNFFFFELSAWKFKNIYIYENIKVSQIPCEFCSQFYQPIEWGRIKEGASLKNIFQTWGVTWTSTLSEAMMRKAKNVLYRVTTSVISFDNSQSPLFEDIFNYLPLKQKKKLLQWKK